MRIDLHRTLRLLAAVVLMSGCDSLAPVEESRMVVEGYLNSGQPLPSIEVRRTLSPSEPYDAAKAAVSDAVVELELDGSSVRYESDSSRRGTYRPADPDSRPLSAGQPYAFRASWNGTVAEASGIIPPAIEITDVSVSVPDEPVSAVLLDSLALADSISTGLYTGYIYPIEVRIAWNDASAANWEPDESWVRAQLTPIAEFSSPVVDLFLRSDEIFRELEQDISSGGRTWTGVYAVGVAESDDVLPEHRLRVSVVRSGPEYARFAASKDTPERREPRSNLDGAVGVFAAIAVDSVHVDVEPNGSPESARP